MSTTSTNSLVLEENKFHTESFTFTTAQVDLNRFSGEEPDPYYFAMPEPDTEIAATDLIIIDGAVKALEDTTPPQAIPSQPDKGIFGLLQEHPE